MQSINELWSGLLGALDGLFEGGHPTQNKLLLSVGLLILLGIARWLALRAIERRDPDPAILYRWRKVTLYVTATATVLALGLIWLEEFRSLATFLGLLSAGLAIALKDLVTSFAGWIFILVRKPFDVGDRIQVGDYSGDVIDLRIFKFTLMEIGNWVHADQSTGRVIHIPNSNVLSEAVINYSRGFQFIWNEIPVLVTFESDWERAKKILHEVADRHAGDAALKAQESLRLAAKRFMLYYKTLTPTVYTTVEASGVLLTIRHLCPPRQRRGMTQAIWEEILRRFAAQPDIEFAYPTQRFYDRRSETEPAAGVAEGVAQGPLSGEAAGPPRLPRRG